MFEVFSSVFTVVLVRDPLSVLPQVTAGGRVAHRFGTWMYPGYLPGMDLSFNSHAKPRNPRHLDEL